MEDVIRIPQYNQLTQSLHEDGKGGYIVRDLPIEKPQPEPEPIEQHEIVPRPYERSTAEIVRELLMENADLKARLAKGRGRCRLVKTALEPVIKDPILTR